ncbi:MAG: hypothetical protein Q9219_005945 [cf. Caloplaca sp. 3 TL-2023]
MHKDGIWHDDPFWVAAAKGDEESVEVLLRYGADAARNGPCGLTPLDVARAEGHDTVVQLLLKASGVSTPPHRRTSGAQLFPFHDEDTQHQYDQLISWGNAGYLGKDSKPEHFFLTIHYDDGRRAILDLLPFLCHNRAQLAGSTKLQQRIFDAMCSTTGTDLAKATCISGKTTERPLDINLALVEQLTSSKYHEVHFGMAKGVSVQMISSDVEGSAA